MNVLCEAITPASLPSWHNCKPLLSLFELDSMLLVPGLYTWSAILSSPFMLLFFMCAAIGSVTFAILVYYYHFWVPNGLPNVPAIPVYVSLAGLWADMGNDEIYDRWLRKPLETYGAVKIWFWGRWSIFTTRPDLLSLIFRNKDLYAKAGNFTLVPWTVTAALVGDNILGAHGEKWKLMSSIIKPRLLKNRHELKLLLVSICCSAHR